MAVSSPAGVPFFDLTLQYASIRPEVEAAVRRVFESQQFILSAEVSSLEKELAGYCGCRHAVACASGSDAILLALLALGIGSGDAVLTSAYSFFATAGYIVRAGARPVFADIEEETFNLDPGAAAAVLARHRNIRAILPVHLYGACANMGPLLEIAARHGIPVIEDAAQAIGAEWHGRRAGSLGRLGCFSFFPTKNLGGCGDGGMVTTDEEGLAERLRTLRVHGSQVKYFHQLVGVNSRLDSLQAAVLRVKLPHLDGWIAARQRNAARYVELLEDTPLRLPVGVAPGVTRHVYNQFVVRTPQRDRLRRHLQDRAIATEIYYPVPLHRQECFGSLGYREGDFPVSEEAARTSLALPVFPELTEEQIGAVSAAIRGFF